MRWLIPGLLALAASCAGGRTFDQDMNSPDYAERPRQFLAPPASEESIRDQSPLMAAVAAAALGFSPDYYRKSTLTGRCVMKSGPQDTLGTPCGSAWVIILKDSSSGLEVARKSPSSDGKFSFSVEKERGYVLSAATRSGSVQGGDAGPFSRGQDVLLTVTAASGQR
jgi:hypothetical protein